jgi:ATP:ADP antiporter, AAA family
LLLLLFIAGFGLSIPALSMVACALVLVWLGVAAIAKREYLHSFRRGLEKKTIEPEAVQLQEADRSTIQTLKALLSSEDERQVLYALDLLSNTHPDRWNGSIDTLIRHPSGVIRARTIAMLSSWNHPTITREEFVRHPDFETAQLASAGVLRLQWTGSVRNRQRLNGLLHDPSPAVRREAIVTAGAVAHREAIPILVETLVDKNLRREARLALLGFGRAAIPELVGRLSDSAERFAIRRHIPKTLALTGKQEAADALVQRFHRLDYRLDFAVLKALNRMRMNSPGIVVDGEFVSAAIRKEREEYDRLTSLQVWLEDHVIDDRFFAILLRALAERRQQRVERVFRLVGLVYPPNDISSVYYNCRIKPALRPAAIEFLDNILAPELKETVVPLLEDSFTEERALHVQSPIELRSIAEVLSNLRNGEDAWLKMIAARLEDSLQRETMSRDAATLSPIDAVLCLQSVDVFKHMTTEMLGYIGAISQDMSVPSQHVIFSEDDISDAMYVVVRGRIRLEKIGNEILLAEAGQSFGTWALFDNQPRMMTATALEDSQLLKIRSEDFYDLLSDHGEMTPVVFRAVIERMNRLIPD